MTCHFMLFLIWSALFDIIFAFAFLLVLSCFVLLRLFVIVCVIGFACVETVVDLYRKCSAALYFLFLFPFSLKFLSYSNNGVGTLDEFLRKMEVWPGEATGTAGPSKPVGVALSSSNAHEN